jgi:hypothetical protein
MRLSNNAASTLRALAIGLTLSVTCSAKDLRGIVVDSQDRPVQKATVILKSEGSLSVRSYISEDDGSFRFANLHPDVYYKVRARVGREETDEVSISRFDKLRDEIIKLKFNVRKEQLR